MSCLEGAEVWSLPRGPASAGVQGVGDARVAGVDGAWRRWDFQATAPRGAGGIFRPRRHVAQVGFSEGRPAKFWSHSPRRRSRRKLDRRSPRSLLDAVARRSRRCRCRRRHRSPSLVFGAWQSGMLVRNFFLGVKFLFFFIFFIIFLKFLVYCSDSSVESIFIIYVMYLPAEICIPLR